MNIQTYFTPTIKKSLVHLVVLLIFIKLTLTVFSNAAEKVRLWDLFTTLFYITAYYIHTLLFFPILIKKKKLKKYLALTISSILIIAFIIMWFQANRSSIITVHLDGTPSSPFDFFLGTQWIISGLLISFIAFIPFSILSLLYYVSIINKEERKELFSMKYAELIVNIIAFMSLCLLLLFNHNTLNYGIKSLYLTGIFSIVFYMNTFVFIPLIFKKRNKIKYLFFNIASFILITYSTKVIYGSHFIKVKELSDNFITLIVFFLITMLLSFTYGYFRAKVKAKNRLIHTRLDAKESELQLLKSQVNPHFLFNTLNTLYATALSENATKTAESTAKLANLLRYMQNDINKDFIPLKNEINYLQDYIIIQKLRCAIEPTITTTFKGISNQTISPGLLIPFVENAFKYGIDPSKKSELTIALICNENTIHFTCINSYNEDYKVHQTEEGFGIGIKNAKQRLDLVYQNKHTFEILKESNTFSVKLTITSKSL